MKFIILMAALVLSVSSVQARSIVCWNAYTQSQGQPVLKAQIIDENKLADVRVNEIAYGAFGENPSAHQRVIGRIIISSDSPYKGNREFNLSHRAQLILPLRLDQNSLSKFSFNGKVQKRSNGVLVLPVVSTGTHVNGNSYLRMFCQEVR